MKTGLGVIKRILGRLTSGLRRGSGSRVTLPTEVSACIPIIKLLESQILDSARKGTTATDELSALFGEMAAQARDTVTQATDGRSQESRQEVEQIRGIVSELLAQVRQTSQSTEETTASLTAIEQDLQEVESCMVRIEHIADQSRMVSLNGQIEAARAGEHGQGFTVVASETGDLAKHVADASQGIREVIDRLTTSLRTTTREAQERVEVDRQAIARCEERVEQMLSELEQYQRDLQANLESTRDSSDQLARAISQAVMTLQFQDAVSQRLNHVTETMCEIRESFGTMVDPDSHAAEQRSAEWMHKLESSYCVDDERLVMSGESAADLAQSHSSDIELF